MHFSLLWTKKTYFCRQKSFCPCNRYPRQTFLLLYYDLSMSPNVKKCKECKEICFAILSMMCPKGLVWSIHSVSANYIKHPVHESKGCLNFRRHQCRAKVQHELLP